MTFDWVGEKIAHVSQVSAASYLFITGTRLGVTSVLFLLSHLAQKGCPRRGHCASFLFIPPPSFFLNECPFAYGLSLWMQTNNSSNSNSPSLSLMIKMRDEKSL